MGLQYYGIDWIGMVLMLISVYLLSDSKRHGFLFGAVGNIVWIVFGVLAASMATILLNSGLFILNLRGWLKWKQH